MRALHLAGILLLLAGCNGPAEDPSPATTTQEIPVPTPTATTPLVATPTTPIPEGPTFAKGILHREPAPASALRIVGASAPAISLMPAGFDVADRMLVQGDNDRSLRIVDANGTERTLRVPSLYHIGRPSLSPDGSQVAVQATLDPADPPSNFDVFVVDLATGDARPVSAGEMNEESPEWSPAGDMIAYSSFSPTEGVNLHLVRPSGAIHLIIPDAGGIHLAFDPTGETIMEVGRLRVYDVEDGELAKDMRAPALEGLAAAGYAPDTRFPGQANRGTFPLDGAFAPDGRSIVFDGAVTKGGANGIVIATMGVDGSNFRIVAGPFEVDPQTTNGLNYSETNPMWR